MPVPTIFSRFLSELGVPHTDAWSDKEFRDMTFKSLFGLSHLLTEYGVKNKGVQFTDKSEIGKLATPFLAQTRVGIFVIVTAINTAANTVEYDSRGEKLKVDLDSFIKAWNGVALLAFPSRDSAEPDYSSHHLTEIVSWLSRYALVGDGVALFAYLFITRHIYTHLSTLLLTVFNCFGLWLTYMLVQKSLNIHTAAADRVCGVLEHGGCDSIVKLKVSKLFGVFSWSEIGFGYFSVSLFALLIFPDLLPSLALCNICCLPYTVWSIWYQKFRARHWCTLCVGVQTTLWLLFFCYLGGGWLAHSLPLESGFFVLIGSYAFVVLAINSLFRISKNLSHYEKDSRT